MGALWAFLNSGFGQTVVLFVIGEVARRLWTSTDRRSQIIAIANRVFEAVEGLARVNGWSSAQKWVHFAAMMTDRMAEQKLDALSGPEMAMLKRLAEDRAAAGKKAVPPPLPGPR